MTRDQVEILICNPGTHPEIIQLAAGLTEKFNTLYATSASFPHDSWTMRIAAGLQATAPKLSSQILRRRLPVELEKHSVKQSGLAAEAAFQLTKRMRPRYTTATLRYRNDAFGKRTRSLVHRTQPNIIVGQYTACAGAFEVAADHTVRILNHPTAHHRWLRQAYRREALANPNWANLLEWEDMTAQDAANMDREIELADYIIVPSSFAANTFQESNIPVEKLITLPLGCHPQDLHPLKPARKPGEPFEVLYVGRVTQRKGIGYLADAIHAVPNARLTIIGECSTEARSKLEGRTSISIRPTVPRSDLLKEMRRHDLVVLPSLADGFGLVGLEAMSVGCPVLLSRTTFAEDIIDDGVNGFILPSTDVPNMVEQLRRISSYSDLTHLKENAWKTAQRYSWSRYRREGLKVIDNLAMHAQRGSCR